MKFKNEIWALIPARSGSKSIINKNITIVKKKPLIAHTLIFCNQISFFKKIIFSSDSIKYLNIAKKYNKKCIFHLRPKKFAKDKSTDLDVFKNFLKEFKKKNIKLPKYFAHMRPTTPFRLKKTIIAIIKNFIKKEKNFSSLRSVSRMPNPSFKTFIIKNKKLCSITNNDYNLDKYNLPKEMFKSTYVPNGYIDIIKTENLMNNKFHGNKVMPIIIEENVIEIDSKVQLKMLNKT